jgi:YebC/PmpR family DNA-binding regulatory protein
MSGHSKWSTIKHKKAETDSRKGKVFSELSKLIRVAVKEGKSGDPNQNPALRMLMDKARNANMPNENVSRAIDRGLGIDRGGVIEEVVYEGYGPGGIGMMVIAHTENRQRTGSVIRSTFDKYGGSLGEPGSVAYLFERSGHNIAVKIPLPAPQMEVRGKLDDLVEMLTDLDDVEEVVLALEKHE